jgi:hypothetical protein
MGYEQNIEVLNPSQQQRIEILSPSEQQQVALIQGQGEQQAITPEEPSAAKSFASNAAKGAVVVLSIAVAVGSTLATLFFL